MAQHDADKMVECITTDTRTYNKTVMTYSWNDNKKKPTTV